MTGLRLRTFAGFAGLAAVGLLASSGLLRSALQPQPELIKSTGSKEKKVNAQPAQNRDHDKAIRQACATYMEAVKKGDLDRIVSFWAPDAEYIDASGKVTSGRDAIATMFKEALPEMKDQKLHCRIHTIRTLRPDVAMEDGTLEVTSPDGNREATRYSVLWVKSGDRWLITHARDLPGQVTESPLPPASRELRQFSWLIGEWEGTRPGTEVKVTAEWGPNKTFLLLTFSVKNEGEPSLLVTERLGWDPVNRVVRSWIFDSLGGFGEGRWERNGHRWTVEVEGVLPEGSSGSSINTWEFVDSITFVWRSTGRTVDGQPMADSETKFVRKAEKVSNGR